MKKTTLTIFALSLSVGGCGWSYATQMEKAREARTQRPVYRAPQTAQPPRQARQAPQAPLVPGARDLYTLGQNHLASRLARGPQQMGLHAFTTHLVDGMNDATQLIHCSTGKTARFDKRTPAPGALALLKSKGIPAGIWTIQIDPSGTRPNLPNNDWYRHIVKHHRLEYIGRNPVDQTVIYQYLGPRPGVGG